MTHRAGVAGGHVIGRGIDPNLILDWKCSSAAHPWSVTALAAPNSQLAGVLAGFMVIGITTLMFNRSQTGRSMGHTVALFAAGTLVLGMDSYLFGSVAATSPVGDVKDSPGRAAQVCQMAWLQVIPAAGMLSLGAGILAAAIGWTLTQHAIDNDYESKHHTTLGNILTGLVLAGTAALIAYTTWVFVDLMAGEFVRVEPDGSIALQADGSAIASISETDKRWAHAAIIVILVTLYLILAALIVPKIYRLWRKMSSKPHWEQVLSPRHRTTEWIGGLSAFYVLTALILVVILPNWTYIYFLYAPEFGETWWPVEKFVLTPRYRLWWSVAMGIGAPSLLFILVANSMPGPFGPVRLRHRRRRLEKECGLARGGLQRLPSGELVVGAVVFEITSEHEYVVTDIATTRRAQHKVLRLESVSSRLPQGGRLAPPVPAPTEENVVHDAHEFWVKTSNAPPPANGGEKSLAWHHVAGVAILTLWCMKQNAAKRDP